MLTVSADAMTDVSIDDANTRWQQQREDFSAARQELRTGVGPRFRALRKKLEEYPLTPYLDYEVASRRVSALRVDETLAYLKRFENSPLENRFLDVFIETTGQQRQWQKLLAVVQTPPRDARLQCFYYRAQWGAGDRALAYRGAAELWNVGMSQDKACDPLFREWFKAEGPNDALVWSRALKAYDRRAPDLIRYVKRFASPTLRPLLDELIAVHHRPDRLVTDDHAADPFHAQLMTVGIRQLARVNPGKARKALLRAEQRQAFTDQQREAMEALILRHSLFAESSPEEGWVIESLARLRDDELTEIYLRNQIKEGDWDALLEGAGWLSAPKAAADEWRYWVARATEEQGDTAAARILMEELSTQRSYHGFLSAERMGKPFALNAEVSEVRADPPLDPAVARVHEWLALGELERARQEWQLLLFRSSADQAVSLARLAQRNGWTALSIAAANHAKAWNDIDLRFPKVYEQAFLQLAAQYQLDAAELVAIARRESGLFPRAESPVGAKGLMQLMPATARAVAKELKLPYRTHALYQPEFNITLGAHYYQTLLERFDGNRPKALAGYNAGPNRVERWSQDALAADQWIDSLPFRETREYVRAVLAYTVIYQQLEGKSATLLSAQERGQTY